MNPLHPTHPLHAMHPMNAMILAAGRGERLGPLTDRIPKPLVPVGDRPVIEHTLSGLARHGIRRVVINVWHLADKLMAHVGDGSAWRMSVTWSREQRLMNTGGGVRQALPLLGDAPFLAVNGDILWNADLSPLLAGFDAGRMDGLLGLVVNPPDGEGDFLCDPADGRLLRGRRQPGAWTYSGIQVLRPQALAVYPEEPFSLNRFYDDAIARGRLFGRVLEGNWADMGTPQRLESARRVWKSPAEN